MKKDKHKGHLIENFVFMTASFRLEICSTWSLGTFLTWDSIQHHLLLHNKHDLTFIFKLKLFISSHTKCIELWLNPLIFLPKKCFLEWKLILHLILLKILFMLEICFKRKAQKYLENTSCFAYFTELQVCKNWRIRK